MSCQYLMTRNTRFQGHAQLYSCQILTSSWAIVQNHPLRYKFFMNDVYFVYIKMTTKNSLIKGMVMYLIRFIVILESILIPYYRYIFKTFRTNKGLLLILMFPEMVQVGLAANLLHQGAMSNEGKARAKKAKREKRISMI